MPDEDQIERDTQFLNSRSLKNVGILGYDVPNPDHEPGHLEDDDRNPPEALPGIHFVYPMYNFYDPRGNGFTSGDRHPWVFNVETDAEGDGNLVVRFPPKASLDPYVPGVENWRSIDGWMVWVSFSDAKFGFDKYNKPVPTRVFEVAEYQRSYWRLKFRGPANGRCLMSCMRLINYSNTPPIIKPDVPARDQPEHGDL